MLDEIRLSLKQQREFYEKYLKEIVPVVQKNEAARKNKLRTAIITSCAFFIVASFVLYLCIINPPKNAKGPGELIILLYTLSYMSWFFIKKDFENSIKEKIMPTVCSCFGNLKWSQGKYFKAGVFTSSYLIPKYTSEEYDDIFNGTLDNVNIEIVEAKYISGSGKYKSTVFNGVVVKLDMNKPFKSRTVIKPSSLMHLSPSSSLHRTEMEDAEFNKQFDIYTNDEVEARYLITPSFMERLKDMETAFRANSVSCAFYNKYLIIALHTNKDLFSICSLVKPIDDEEQYLQMYEELVSITKLIDHFKLNQKIGL